MPRCSYCYVPMCSSTGISTPEKHFFVLSKGDSRRASWLKSIKRYSTEVSPNSVIQVCEDHFNLEEDLENYVRYRLQPTIRPRLKKDVVPHIFTCQNVRNVAKRQRSHTIERIRKKLALDILESWENKSRSEGTSDEVTRTQNMDVLTKDIDAAVVLLNLSSLAAAGLSSPERITKSYIPVTTTTPIKKPIYVSSFKVEPIETPRNPPLTRLKTLELSQVSDSDSQSISASSDSFVVTSNNFKDIQRASIFSENSYSDKDGLNTHVIIKEEPFDKNFEFDEEKPDIHFEAEENPICDISKEILIKQEPIEDNCYNNDIQTINPRTNKSKLIANKSSCNDTEIDSKKIDTLVYNIKKNFKKLSPEKR